jgi:hypothetical protein
VALASLVVSLIAGVLPAGATTQIVRSAGLTATFSYHGTSPMSHHPHLIISDDGKVVYNRAVTSAWCGKECSPNTIAENRTVVHIVRLGSGPPSVVLDLYSGGAHCCFIEQVYSLGANSMNVRKSEYNFGNPGVRLMKLRSGGEGFLSANNAFAYEFTDFAASGMPIEIFDVSHNAFHNVTTDYPSLIRKDAEQWIRAFRAQAGTHYQDTVGVIAAWAADEDMLGHTTAVAKFLVTQAGLGHLNSALSPIEASGQKYVVALQKFLRNHGYTH